MSPANVMDKPTIVKMSFNFIGLWSDFLSLPLTLKYGKLFYKIF